MRYLSVCSGIEAATVAWHPLGWTPVAFSEIEKFPAAVLQHHYPHVPNWGDMTKFKEWPDAAIDVLVGGTPCQSFSVAGLRKGLADPRGNLALAYLAILDRYRPTWCVWENVPGVLSSGGGRDFGTFLGGLGQLGYGFAYRVLDAQFFGVAQRRRRVFVVGHLGDWRRAAAVLFDRESVSGHPAPRRETRQDVAGTFGSRSTAGGGFGGDFETTGGLVPMTVGTLSDGAQGGGRTGRTPTPAAYLPSVANPLTARMHKGINTTLDEGQTLIGGSFDVAATIGQRMRGQDDLCADNLQVCAVRTAQTSANGHGIAENVAHTLDGAQGQAIAFGWQNSASQGDSSSSSSSVFPSLDKSKTPAVGMGMAVRRLTPVECARLQGFPDHYLNIIYRGKPAADGPKYKALGNSMAVPVMRWIGKRIQLVEDTVKAQVA